MKNCLALGLLLVGLATPVMSQSLTDPEELLTLRQKRQEAVALAMKPLDLKYRQSLIALKTRFTQAGNLTAAVVVDKELKKLDEGAATNLTASPTSAKAFALGDLDGKWTTDGGRVVELSSGDVLENGKSIGSVKILNAQTRSISLVVGQYTDTLEVSSNSEMMVGKNSVNDRAWWKRAK